MSLLIKGMDMPKNCAGCDLSTYDDGYNGGYGYNPPGRWCRRLKRLIKEGESKPVDCPIVEIPTPHGRLIDTDELIKRLNESGNYVSPAIMACIETAPTIIEAEQGDG